MGEERKLEEEANKVEDAAEAVKKEEDKKKEEEKQKKEDEEESEIVLKVDMHCEACARKVTRALKGFQGVENVTADCKGSKVVVKCKSSLDPTKLCERIYKKSGRKVELISPLPKPPEPAEDNKSPPQDPAAVEEKKEEPPAVITVVLNVQMHCEACAQVLQKRIGKVKGVESVTTDVANNRVVVKGVINPEKLVSDVYKRTRKQAWIVVKEEEKREEEKKEEDQVKIKEEEKKERQVEGENNNIDGKNGSEMMKRSEYWPPSQRYSAGHYNMDHYAANYAYPPQIFSDENPHACSVM